MHNARACNREAGVCVTRTFSATTQEQASATMKAAADAHHTVPALRPRSSSARTAACCERRLISSAAELATGTTAAAAATVGAELSGCMSHFDTVGAVAPQKYPGSCRARQA